jgi:hypothetical protein
MLSQICIQFWPSIFLSALIFILFLCCCWSHCHFNVGHVRCFFLWVIPNYPMYFLPNQSCFMSLFCHFSFFILRLHSSYIPIEIWFIIYFPPQRVPKVPRYHYFDIGLSLSTSLYQSCGPVLVSLYSFGHVPTMSPRWMKPGGKFSRKKTWKIIEMTIKDEIALISDLTKIYFFTSFMLQDFILCLPL